MVAMKRPRLSLWHSLPPLVAGLLLFATGWSVNTSVESARVPSQVVFSPLPLQSRVIRGSSKEADSQRWDLEAAVSFELSRPNWPSKAVRVEPEPGVTAIRLSPPRGTLSVSVSQDAEAEVEFLRLPKKDKVASSQGQARLEPGPHELLVSATGYLPKRLSVDIRPGEVKKMAVTLERIPGLPAGFELGTFPTIPNVPSAPPAGWTPPARTWTPPPVWSPPPPARPTRPVVPVPRFTPVAPIPNAGTANPQPMFTPIGN